MSLHHVGEGCVVPSFHPYPAINQPNQQKVLQYLSSSKVLLPLKHLLTLYLKAPFEVNSYLRAVESVAGI